VLHRDSGRSRNPSPEIRWGISLFLIRAVPVRGDDGVVVGWYGTNTDIEDRKRAEALLTGENQLLERLAQGEALESILDGVCRMVEGIFRDSFVSIMLVNPTTIGSWYAASGSLPPAYTEALNGLEIGPSQGSCGAAAYRNAPVIVDDRGERSAVGGSTETSPARFGLRSCWSTPIRSADGTSLARSRSSRDSPARPRRTSARRHRGHTPGEPCDRTHAQRNRPATPISRSFAGHRRDPQLIVAMSPAGQIL